MIPRLPVVVAACAALSVFVGASVASAVEVDGAASATEPAVRIGNQTPTQVPPTPPQPESVQYRVTVLSEWTQSSHPTTLPPNSHFSPSVVVAHGDVGDLFVRGAVASDGIEQMAETGSTSTLVAELAGDASVTSTQVGSSIFGAGENEFVVTLTKDASLVSAVTMLAPSPDWFVGVRDVSMFVEGEWLDVIEFDLSNYDAGTDSGTSWTSPNFDTDPAAVISGPVDAAFSAAVAESAFGRIVVERI